MSSYKAQYKSGNHCFTADFSNRESFCCVILKNSSPNSFVAKVSNHERGENERRRVYSKYAPRTTDRILAHI